MENKSFIITGASASGKSTLIEEAKTGGYIYLPTHMTRNKRPGEVDGESAIFLSNKEFEENYYNGVYLEPSLDFACLKALNVYYGTPRKWLEYLSKNNYCSSPVSIQIAREIYKEIQIMWIHLLCTDEDRYKRLIARGISEEEIEKRMKSGDSIYIPDEATCMNTSELKPNEILKRIRRL